MSRSDQQNKDVGERLAVLREVFSLSQTSAAREAGVSQNVWSHWETGRNLADARALIRISDKFGVTTDWILRGVLSGMSSELVAKILAANDKRRRAG